MNRQPLARNLRALPVVLAAECPDVLFAASLSKACLFLFYHECFSQRANISLPQASPSTVWGAVMLAIYLVGRHVRTRLTRPVARAINGLLLSSRGLVALNNEDIRDGRILRVHYFSIFSATINLCMHGCSV